MGEKLLVPANGPVETLVEGEQWTPAQELVGPPSAQVLIADFVGSLVTDRRGQRGAHPLQDALNQFEHSDLDLIGKVEGCAAQFGAAGELLTQEHRGSRPVLNIKVIAAVVAVGTDHGRIAAKNRADGAGNDARPVQVAAAVEITAAAHRH